MKLFFLGGGMPIGTLMLIEEDYAGSYAKLIMKYFLAEVREITMLHLLL